MEDKEEKETLRCVTINTFFYLDSVSLSSAETVEVSGINGFKRCRLPQKARLGKRARQRLPRENEDQTIRSRISSNVLVFCQENARWQSLTHEVSGGSMLVLQSSCLCLFSKNEGKTPMNFFSVFVTNHLRCQATTAEKLI
ncbi:hypothetical protein PoB_001246600 [Plakobranchus ocellatus]|uniref:Uncharacterized protein n=1 Tax=Plakobranchus ocellatus TaxID=259542 RepID=A0AAV3YUD0_9GAST|nr:hypothetical protein PoB_001246600 [Plakobranchus ocellatus]